MSQPGGVATQGGVPSSPGIGDVFNVLQKEFETGLVTPNIDVLTKFGTTAALLYASTKKVRYALIQNVSTTDDATLVIGTSGNIVVGATSGKGIVLARLATEATAGKLGTMSFIVMHNVDLSTITVITNVTAGTSQTLVVYYET